MRQKTVPDGFLSNKDFHVLSFIAVWSSLCSSPAHSHFPLLTRNEVVVTAGSARPSCTSSWELLLGAPPKASPGPGGVIPAAGPGPNPRPWMCLYGGWEGVGGGWGGGGVPGGVPITCWNHLSGLRRIHSELPARCLFPELLPSAGADATLSAGSSFHSALRLHDLVPEVTGQHSAPGAAR